MTRTMLQALVTLALLMALALGVAPYLPSLAAPPTPAPAGPPAGGVTQPEASPGGPTVAVPTPGVAPVQTEEPWNEARLTRWLEESASAPYLLYGLKGLMILLGVLFLVGEFLSADGRRHGITPAGWGPWRARHPLLDPLMNAFGDGTRPPATPRHATWPTAVAEPLAAVGLAIGFPVAVQFLMVALWPPHLRPGGPLEFGIAAATLGLLPPALLTALRRLRLGRGQLPGPATALGLGFKFACIATLIVVPVQMLWGYLLLQRGTPLEVQNVVQAFADPANPGQPWLIAVFGVFVAPFTEEAVFRGLLYPALRGRVPGGPFGAAVLVALLFALIHGNLMAFVPLFALALVLAWVMERTNSLMACVTVHALHNASSLAPMIGRLLEGTAAGNGT